MRRLFSIADIRVKPMYYIEFVVGVVSVVGGLMILGPAFVTRPPTHFFEVFDVIGSEPAIAALGMLAILSGLLTIIGMMGNKLRLRSAGMFLQFMLRLYTLIGVLLVYGLYPLSWLSALTMTLISAIIWLNIKSEPHGP